MPDTLCGDFHGNKENFYCCGRANFFQASDRQEKGGVRGAGKALRQGRQPGGEEYDQRSKLALRKSRVVHEAPEAGLKKEDDDSSDNDGADDDDDEAPGDDDDEEDSEAADVGSYF